MRRVLFHCFDCAETATHILPADVLGAAPEVAQILRHDDLRNATVAASIPTTHGVKCIIVRILGHCLGVSFVEGIPNHFDVSTKLDPLVALVHVSYYCVSFAFGMCPTSKHQHIVIGGYGRMQVSGLWHVVRWSVQEYRQLGPFEILEVERIELMRNFGSAARIHDPSKNIQDLPGWMADCTVTEDSDGFGSRGENFRPAVGAQVEHPNVVLHATCDGESSHYEKDILFSLLHQGHCMACQRWRLRPILGNHTPTLRLQAKLPEIIQD